MTHGLLDKSDTAFKYGESNLVTTIDRIMRLYVPILGKWMEDNPDFHGIDTSVGIENPSAFPEDETGMGYTDEAFEEMATSVLVGLADETISILEACPVLRAAYEPLSVKASRRGQSITIMAGVSDGLGSIAVRRKASKRPQGPIYIFKPCTLTVLSKIDNAVLQKEYEALGRKAIVSIIDFNVVHGLAVNIPLEKSAILHDWLAAFPAPFNVGINHLGGGLYASSCASEQGDVKIFVEAGPHADRICKSHLNGMMEIEVYPDPTSRHLSIPTV